MAGLKKRTQQVVDRRVQGALARRVIFHFCTFIVMGAALGLTLQFLSDPFTSFSTHCANFWRNSGPHIAVLVLLLPVFVCDTLKLSNRIAGPIVRLRSTMTKIRNGEETEKVKFRDGDYWQEMAGEFNEMVHELKRHERSLLEHAASDESQLESAV